MSDNDDKIIDVDFSKKKRYINQVSVDRVLSKVTILKEITDFKELLLSNKLDKTDYRCITLEPVEDTAKSIEPVYIYLWSENKSNVVIKDSNTKTVIAYLGGLYALLREHNSRSEDYNWFLKILIYFIDDLGLDATTFESMTYDGEPVYQLTFYQELDENTYLCISITPFK